MIITLSIIIYVIINILDIISTILVGNIGGVELNPIALWTMQWGYVGFIVIKLLGVSIFSLLAIYLSTIESNIVNLKRATIIATNLFNAFMLYVVINNFYIAFANW